MKKPPFELKVGMDFTLSAGSDCYTWRIIEVDKNGKGFTAAQYSPRNKATWPAQDWVFEDENGQPLLNSNIMHAKYGYGRWVMDKHSFYIGEVKERIYPGFGKRYYYQDPSF